MDIFQALYGPRARAAAQRARAMPTAWVSDQIDRYRHWWFGVVAVFLLLSFNGQWHLGPDSAGYRQLGHNLAAHGKYFFRADVPGVDQYHNEQGTRYPGLPMLLAGLEIIFGPGALPPLVMSMAMAVASLALIYRLLLYRVPRWLAVCVVVGMGMNPRFLQYANEILSDMPFLLGVVLTLLGFERLMHVGQWRPLAAAMLYTFAGIVLAASMRPTFLLLGAALAIACAWGIYRGRVGLASEIPDPNAPSPVQIRRRSALLVGLFIGATILFVCLIDIRSRHGGFLSGGYEQRMMSKIENFGTKVAPLLSFNLAELLEDALPMAVVGYRAGWGLVPLAGHALGIGATLSMVFIISGICLARRNVLWGSFVFVTIGALIFAGPVPRYFLMILPMLLAGWGLFWQWLAQKLRSKLAARAVFAFGLLLVVISNAATSFTFILTQRGFTKPFDAHRHWQGIHYVGFLRTYDFGRWIGFDALGDDIRNATDPPDMIIGPDANVLTFLSDRQVYAPEFDRRTHTAGRLFHLAIFPADVDWHASTEEYPRELKQFCRILHRQQGTVLAGPAGGYLLAQVAPLPAHRMTPAEKLEHFRRLARHRAAALRAAAASHR
jgi:hypothetical protein